MSIFELEVVEANLREAYAEIDALRKERDDYREALENNHNNGYLCQWMIDPKNECDCNHREVLAKYLKEKL